MSRSREGFLWTPSYTVEGLTTEAKLKSSVSSPTHQLYDVIVIGTGFAGLIAARELTQTRQNLKVLLLEARDRIGGRTWTAKALGEEFEMGGTWVHWNQPHLYAELVRYDLQRNLKSSAGTLAPQKQYYTPPNGSPIEIPAEKAAEITENIATEFFEIDGLDSRQLMPYPHDPFREPALWKKYDHLTVRQRLDSIENFSQNEKDLFESQINTFGSAPGSDIGFVEALRWYALGGHSIARVFELAGIYKIGHGGMSSLARSILQDFHGDILCDSPVSGIYQNGNVVTIRIKNENNFRAKTVVSTVPLNCLSDITFGPSLSPLRQEAISHGQMNKGAKIHFKLGAVEPGWFSTCAGDGSSPFVFAFSDHNGSQQESTPIGTYCIGFGYNGHLTDKKDSKHIIQHFQQHLRPGADVQAYLTHDWMNDPYAKGVWSCWGPNAMTKYLQELQKPHGLVVFANADWADGWRGFVDGAIERGYVAAREIKDLLNGSSLTNIDAKL